jgi:hypothetical protein
MVGSGGWGVILVQALGLAEGLTGVSCPSITSAIWHAGFLSFATNNHDPNHGPRVRERNEHTTCCWKRRARTIRPRATQGLENHRSTRCRQRCHERDEERTGREVAGQMLRLGWDFG